MKKIFILFFTYSLVLSNNFAQNIPELITDRPDQTESTALVPQGSLQVETGIVFSQTKVEGIFGDTNINEYSIFGTLFRYGLNNSFELRAGGGYFKTDADPLFNESGFGDFIIGTKYLLPVKNIDMALLAHLNLPVGNETYSPEKVEPELILSAAKDLSENISLGINLGGNWDSVIEEVSFFYTAALGFGLNEKLGTFVEVYGNLKEELHNFDGGVTYLISPNVQMDASAGINLNGEYTTWFLSSGISFRIPN
ncbi:MAG: transporter [Melioribacteraceae bacterium]|nr:MAG: transporter [Melioribacteraceae bacterium]